MKSRLWSFGNRRRHCGSRGQSLVEFAIVAPVLILFLLAVTDFGRVFFVSIALNNAARAGTQYGIQSPANAADVSGMQQAAQTDASNISGVAATASEFCECPDGSTPACDSSPSCSDLRVYVEVDTTGSFQTLLNYPGIPSSISLTGKSVMRAE
jgi:Flp pilus assembly protein TadG